MILIWCSVLLTASLRDVPPLGRTSCLIVLISVVIVCSVSGRSATASPTLTILLMTGHDLNSSAMRTIPAAMPPIVGP